MNSNISLLLKTSVLCACTANVKNRKKAKEWYHLSLNGYIKKKSDVFMQLLKEIQSFQIKSKLS